MVTRGVIAATACLSLLATDCSSGAAGLADEEQAILVALAALPVDSLCELHMNDGCRSVFIEREVHLAPDASSFSPDRYPVFADINGDLLHAAVNSSRPTIADYYRFSTSPTQSAVLRLLYVKSQKEGSSSVLVTALVYIPGSYGYFATARLLRAGDSWSVSEVTIAEP